MKGTGCACAMVCAAVLVLTGCDEEPDDGPELPAPTRLVATPIESSWVQLSWVDNSGNEEGFRIYRDDSSGFVELDTVPAGYLGYSDFTVTDGEFYTYYVVGYVGETESAHSNHSTVEAGPPYVMILTPPNGATLTLGEMYDVTWQTNMPGFDAEIWLSMDGGTTWPPQHRLELSWMQGSPWPWKSGYSRASGGPLNWEQVITSTCTECKIFMAHYAEAGVQGWSEGTFTITVP